MGRVLVCFLLALGGAVARAAAAASAPSQYFLHLTDTHLDRHYRVGAPNRCLVGTGLGTGCCRAGDVPLGGSAPCGPWGDLDADSPPALVDGVLSWVAAHAPPLAAVFQTGDDASHHDVTQTAAGNVRNVEYVAGALRRHLGPDVPLFNAVGNHDTYPIDQTAPLVYPSMLRSIGRAYGRPNATHGYYSAPLGAGLQVVALNAIYYDAHNAFRVRDAAGDARVAGGQFAWLRAELAAAHAAGRRVVLLTHIPIGGGESTPFYDAQLAAALRSAPEPPLIQLCGHEHYDHFYLYFGAGGSSTAFGSVLAPNSVVPSHNYPGFRVYEYDPGARAVVDYTQYSCDLARSNAGGANGSLACGELYRFRDLYAPAPDVSTASLADLHRRMRTNATLLRTYVAMQNVGEPAAETASCAASAECLRSKYEAIAVTVA